LYAVLANMAIMARKHVPKGVASFAEALRLLREGQGLTLRALAQKIGVSAPFLSDLEHGRRQTDKYDELAQALDVPVEELRELDTRVPPDLKEWLASNPKLGTPCSLRGASRHRSARPVVTPGQVLHTVTLWLLRLSPLYAMLANKEFKTWTTRKKTSWST